MQASTISFSYYFTHVLIYVFPLAGHFTQVVWKETKELGVGRAKSNTGKLYIVAYYSPPGNYSRCYLDNVPPLKKY